MKRATAIIPARFGSTRFPGKPLHLIAGKPLLQYVWQAVRRAEAVDKVIIATDDMRIAEEAFYWGAEVALTSAKHQSGTDRIAEVASKLRNAAYIINVQGDEPLVEPGLINSLVQSMRRDPKCEIITAGHPFDDPEDAKSPHQVKVVLDLKAYALYFSRAPIASGSNRVFRHQGIYGFRRETLLRFVKWKPSSLERAEGLEQLRALENGVRVHVLVTKHGSPGVDTPQDARALEQKIVRARRKGARK
jgi:3-deoxy-manno-octulosonate cytidylyltransferase (CMP-KDO synthetase)